MIRPITLLVALSIPAHAETTISPFTENVLLHVMTHEMGHAVIREFDLPILANEEIAADQFATFYLHQRFPDRVGDIVRARARSWEVEAEDETIFAEHPDDLRRAGYTLCFLYGLDPDRHADLATEFDMTEDDAADCRDTAPEIARAWRRILAPLAMPPGARVTEVRLRAEDGPWKAALGAGETGEIMASLLSSIDWHSQITLQLKRCDGGASWSRNGREITICDGLIDRFQEQALRIGDRD